MKKPDEIIMCLPVDSKPSEFVRWDGKPMRDYFINIPTWMSEAYIKHGVRLVIVKVSYKKSLNEKFKEENYKEYVRSNWSSKLTKMRKLNNGYTKVMTELSPRAFFDTHEGYIKYHEELKALNEKYMRPIESKTADTRKGSEEAER